MIYAIRANGTKYIKFGISTPASIRKRINGMQVGCPYELELVAKCDGGRLEEMHIHMYLKARKQHVRGEWYKYGDEAKLVIQAMLESYPKRLVPTLPQINHNSAHRLARILEYAQSASAQGN